MYPLYDPSLEHDACGIGLIGDVTARPRRDVVALGLTALQRMAHRGGRGPDGAVDGCGVLTAIPWSLLDGGTAARRGGRIRAVGMFFLQDSSRDARDAVGRELRRGGFDVDRWRAVPVDPSALASSGRAGAPAIWQLFLSAAGSGDAEAALYRARLELESAVAAGQLPPMTVVSLSSRTVVYKGLVEPAQLARFYPDLADARYESPFILVHQRFSTNTSSDWALAQPFRLLAHNGEINTVAGNRMWMRARLRDAASTPSLPGDAVGGVSDSQTLDMAIDLLRVHGYALPHAIARLVPPAWERDRDVADEVRAFFEFQALASEPWEGPAALVFCDGRHAGAALDRNGFRPARITRTANGLIAVTSESGVLGVPDEEIVDRQRLRPGEMLAIDLARGTLLAGADLHRALARTRPYRQIVRAAVRPVPRFSSSPVVGPCAESLARAQVAFGCTREEIEMVLKPMIRDGHEAVGSMGDDTPPAVLSAGDRLLSDFFRQRFAQVTNPPVDPYRERTVMSLVTRLGSQGSFVDETVARPPRAILPSPILTVEQLQAVAATDALGAAVLDATLAVADGAEGLERGLERLTADACVRVAGGASVLVLSDAGIGPDRAPIPALLATSAVHHGLIAAGLRPRVSLVVHTGDARDAHAVAALVAYGAAAVCPYLGYDTVAGLPGAGEQALTTPEGTYRLALQRGVLRIMSKMGVCTIAGYCGAQLFETLGLDRAFVARYFPGTPAPLGGIGVLAVAAAVLARHRRAFAERPAPLAYPGLHSYRQGGEYHALNPLVVRKLHDVRGGSDDAYGSFTELVYSRPPSALRDLLAFRQPPSIALEQVEPVEDICRRFFASAMSVGALAPEAHRTVAIAMNRLQARSNSGEGGEEPARFARPDGRDWAGSRTKQIASARFGVTAAYLLSGDEIQIKIAQGSKPGEGGQLPGEKVVAHIAALRHARPGTTLISPPVHHDIYSIEDLAQLVFDLRALHPRARINVKLVATTGVGIIAAGVVKAGADAIQISGHDGGTGASPRSSIKHAGMPWELGLAEAHQVLSRAGLRDRVVLQTDGGLKTGRDIAIAAALGAEEFGFGTAALVAIGCVMARQCHLNTCPVGIATQRSDLRARFAGTPDMLVGYLHLVAGEVRSLLAALGVRSIAELVGRADLLERRVTPGPAAALDLTPLLTAVPAPARTLRAARRCANGRAWVQSLDRLTNADRTVGASLAAARILCDEPSATDTHSLTVSGTAGQSFGAFCVQGLTLTLTGDANDFVAKGMSGGDVIVRPHPRQRGRLNQVLIGNTALYGATGGALFVAGCAGERFAVRNSGATAVVEGVGDHACEYMTGGLVLVLGSIGRNFAAGMTGGVAYVLDTNRCAAERCNAESVAVRPIGESDRPAIRALLVRHHALTGSRVARSMLRKSDEAFGVIRRIVPTMGADAAIADEPAAFMASRRRQKAIAFTMNGGIAAWCAADAQTRRQAADRSSA